MIILVSDIRRTLHTCIHKCAMAV